jgi:serine/threonine protein kinase
LINKFFLNRDAELDQEDFSVLLAKYGFMFARTSQVKSTNPIWEGLISGKRYFIKIAQSGTQYFATLAREFSIFQSLNPEIEVLRFEGDGYLITAIEELPPAKKLLTGEVFNLIDSCESRLNEMPSLLSKNFNLNLLIDFSSNAISYFRFSEQLGAYWISRLEDDVDILNDFFNQTKQVIVHGDVGPANILESSSGLVLIDWGDAFWGFQGFDQLYWLTFLQNSRDLNKNFLDKLHLDFELCQSTLNVIVLLKEYLHRHNAGQATRVPPKFRLESVQVS